VRAYDPKKVCPSTVLAIICHHPIITMDMTWSPVNEQRSTGSGFQMKSTGTGNGNWVRLTIVIKGVVMIYNSKAGLNKKQRKRKLGFELKLDSLLLQFKSIQEKASFVNKQSKH
jgi:ribosomal protein L34